MASVEVTAEVNSADMLQDTNPSEMTDEENPAEIEEDEEMNLAEMTEDDRHAHFMKKTIAMVRPNPQMRKCAYPIFHTSSSQPLLGRNGSRGGGNPSWMCHSLREPGRWIGNE